MFFSDRCLSFFFWPLCVCSSSIYRFWLQTIFYYTWNNVHACTDTEKFNTYFKDLIC
jgi:hypothetical protein